MENATGHGSERARAFAKGYKLCQLLSNVTSPLIYSQIYSKQNKHHRAPCSILYILCDIVRGTMHAFSHSHILPLLLGGGCSRGQYTLAEDISVFRYIQRRLTFAGHGRKWAAVSAATANNGKVYQRGCVCVCSSLFSFLCVCVCVIRMLSRRMFDHTNW